MGAGRYFEETRIAFGRAPMASWLLVGIWLVYPVAVQTVLHPSDAVGFQDWLQGLTVPHEFTRRMLMAGELSALFGLVGLSLGMFVATIMLYRKAGFWFRLWPLVGLVSGFFGNLGWWIHKGYFDPVGALAGLAPLSLAVMIFALCDKLGRDFVFGKDAKAAQAGA
jgi:hypothetical protein